MNEKILSKTPVMIFVAMICCLLWGSAFPCIKIGYRLFNIEGSDTASQILFAGCRFAIAGTMVILVSCITNKSFTKPKNPMRIATLSAFQTVIQYLFFYMGLAHTTGVKSSIITGSGTFLTLFVCAIGFKQEKLTTKKIVGSILGFLGIILVNVGGNNIDFDFSLTGEGFVMIAAFSSAMASGFIKKFSKDSDVVMLSGYQFFFGGIVMAITGFLLGGGLGGVTPVSICLILYMGFISAAAYTLWGLLLKHNDVSKVSTCKFMNPVFGVILSFILLKENGILGANVFVALILVCVGIFIVNFRKSKT
jgi:drug/metabolite transporter (DMT)-like permease